MTDKFISASEAARRLGISRERVGKLLRAGRFPNAFKVPDVEPPRWLIPVTDLDAPGIKERLPGRPKKPEQR